MPTLNCCFFFLLLLLLSFFFFLLRCFPSSCHVYFLPPCQTSPVNIWSHVGRTFPLPDNSTYIAKTPVQIHCCGRPAKKEKKKKKKKKRGQKEERERLTTDAKLQLAPLMLSPIVPPKCHALRQVSQVKWHMLLFLSFFCPPLPRLVRKHGHPHSKEHTCIKY